MISILLSVRLPRSLVRTLLLAALFALSACNGKSRVLASVNGRNVTQAEFDAYLRVKHISPRDDKTRERALDEYLEREALADAIEKEALLDKALIEAELRETKKEILISRYFDRFLEQKVSDVAVKNYYDKNAKNYEQRKVHVAHILVRTNRKSSDEERKAKLTTAQEIHSKLQAGQSFEDLAKVASEDRISGAKGGDLGWLREGSIDPEFSKHAFSMKTGAVSEPFQTEFGFHVLKVLEEPKVVRKPYDAVIGDIGYQLRAEAKDAEVKRLKEKLSIKKRDAYKLDEKALAAASAAVPARRPLSPELPKAQNTARVTSAIQQVSDADPATAELPSPTPVAKPQSPVSVRNVPAPALSAAKPNR